MREINKKNRSFPTRVYFGPIKIGAPTPGGFAETKTFRTALIVVFLDVERAVFTQIARLTVDVRFTETFGIHLQCTGVRWEEKKIFFCKKKIPESFKYYM